jgi:probable phosphoglycerate mutase
VRLLLVRHALCDPVGVSLSGRRPGVSLNAAGRAQLAPLAARVARRLGGAPLGAVVASPLARAQETAGALARAHGPRGRRRRRPRRVRLRRVDRPPDRRARRPRELAALQHVPQRHARPGGELALEAQARAVGAVLRLAAEHPDGCVAAVSHADVIKAVLGHLLGVPLDLQHRLEVAPASVSEAELRPWGARVLAVNDAA